MSSRVTSAVALRVLRQLRRDPRTIALLMVVPPVLLTILKYAFDESPSPSSGSAGRWSACSRS